VGYKGQDLPADKIESLIQELQELNVEVVCLNGHGETTFHDDWQAVFRAAIGKFPQTHLTSNLAMEYTDEDIDLLSRLNCINVSIDTHDPVLLEATRRKVNLKTILENIQRIRQVAVGRSAPEFSFSCVVHDKNISDLPAFARFAVSLGISHVTFCNLTKYPDIPGAVNVYPVSADADHVSATAALESLSSAEGILAAAGVGSSAESGLRDSLECFLTGLQNKYPAPTGSPMYGAKTLAGDVPEVEDTSQAGRERSFKRPAPGETRDCLYPWTFRLVKATGEVAPCCWRGRPLVNDNPVLHKDGSLTDMLNDENSVMLRKRLLTGDLDEACVTCPVSGVISIDDFCDKVAEQGVIR
jgi:MoaA/NifB/PqqE/SkfB family radical SAM enzyme